MTWPKLTQNGIRTSFRAELTLSPDQLAICVEINLTGPLPRPMKRFTASTYDITPCSCLVGHFL